jgi:hypothetical protein
MRNSNPPFLFAVLMAAVTTAAALPGVSKAEGHAHVHGTATVEIAVDVGQITVRLDSPLDNLIGFEHPPATPEQKQLAEHAETTLRAGSQIRIDPAGACTLTNVDLQSAALGLGTATADPDGHADINATYQFHCQKSDQVQYVEVGFASAFKRIRTVNVDIVTNNQQLHRVLHQDESKVLLR